MSFNFINIKKIENEAVTIHCVQAPEDGEMVNAQIIETPNKLLLIDTLQLKPHADELKLYIDSLNKPLDKILISHHHPDHWFGAASFEGYPISAFPEVIGIINALADYLLGYHRSLHPETPDVIPSNKVLPTIPLEEGTIDFDGITINLQKVYETECPVNLVVEIPDHKILLAQDLVYNKAYPYFGERTQAGEYGFDNWIAVLESFEAKGYEHISFMKWMAKTSADAYAEDIYRQALRVRLSGNAHIITALNSNSRTPWKRRKYVQIFEEALKKAPHE